MLSLFVTFTLSERPFTWKWATHRPYWGFYASSKNIPDFTIIYRNVQAWDWFAYFIVDSGPYQYISGANEGKAKYGKISFSSEFSYPFNNYDNYLLIEFVAKNDDTEPHNISLYHGIDLERDQTQNYQGDRGITINEQNRIYTIIARDGYGVTNADGYWFNGINDFIIFDYFGPDPELYWFQKTIYPNETKRFGVLLGLSELNLKNPPKITLKTQPRQNNMPNQEITVIVNVFEIDSGERVTLYYNFNGKTNEAGRLDSGNGNTNKDFTIKVNLCSDVNRYPLEIWAEDTVSLKSNVIDLDLLVNQRPQLTIINQVNNVYSKNMVVEIVGTIWDDTKAHISYQIDNHFAYDVEGDYVCNKNTKQFSTAFRIKDKQISYDTHTLKIWATDEFGVKSDVKSFTFEYLQTNTPEIKINQSNYSIYYANQYIVINGQIRDLDYDDQLSIYYLSPTSSPIDSFQFIKTMSSNSSWMDFEMIYQIPDLVTGNYSIIFKVVDQRDSNSLYDYYSFAIKKLVKAINRPTIINTSVLTYIIRGKTITTYINSSIEYYITTDIAISTREMSQISKNSNAYIGIPPYKKEETSVIENIWPIIVGIIAGVVLVIVLAAIIIYHEAKKKAHKFNSEGEVIPEGEDLEDDDPSSSKKYIFEGEERSEYGVII